MSNVHLALLLLVGYISDGIYTSAENKGVGKSLSSLSNPSACLSFFLERPLSGSATVGLVMKTSV